MSCVGMGISPFGRPSAAVAVNDSVCGASCGALLEAESAILKLKSGQLRCERRVRVEVAIVTRNSYTSVHWQTLGVEVNGHRISHDEVLPHPI